MNRKIGILGAMPEEIHRVTELMHNISTHNIANRIYYCGLINQIEVVVAFSKWGKVAAAMSTTNMIDEFHITELIFIGTAGALAEELKIGDVVVAKRLVQHDMDSRPMLQRFEIPLLNRLYLDTDSTLTDDSGRAIESLFENNIADIIGSNAALEFNITKPKICFGDIASGDQFINSDEKRDELISLLPNVKCVEMEGAAVAQVCTEYEIPFTVIRTISDTANHNAKIDFGNFIKEVASIYSKKIIEQIIVNNIE